MPVRWPALKIGISRQGKEGNLKQVILASKVMMCETHTFNPSTESTFSEEEEYVCGLFT